MLVRQINAGRAGVENEFTRAVTPQGNRRAQVLMDEVFELRDDFEWRGLGTLPHSDAAQAALWRLRELPAPKPRLAIDHRIRSDFVMSPFPSAPWKFDWEDNDRTQSQRMMPLFEASAYTVYAWKHSPLEYKASSVAVDYPGADFLFAYWLGRSLDLFTAAD